jgi:hypothetical protein
MLSLSSHVYLRVAAAALACSSLGACATLTQGTHQNVAITTPGATDATCHLTGGDAVDATVMTPGSVRVPKSKKDITVACDAPGQPTRTEALKSAYSNWSIVQYPLGYAVDGISGAMWVYPKTLVVPFDPAAKPSQQSEAAPRTS